MSASRWKTEAAKIIAGVLKSLPPGSDEKTKRKAIRAAYPWGERKRWPYKCWCDVACDALLIARPTSGPKKRGRKKPAPTSCLFSVSVPLPTASPTRSRPNPNPSLHSDLHQPMKLPHKTNPALVASKDAARHVLQNVLLTNELAVATDGRRLVAICVEHEPDDPPEVNMLVPVKAITAACHKARKPILAGQIALAEHKATVKNFDVETSFACPGGSDLRFPSYWQVIPDVSLYTMKLAINAELLAGLAKAMGQETVTLHLDPAGFSQGFYQPAIVVTNGRGDCAGILMPCRILDVSLDQNRAIQRIEIDRVKASKRPAPAEKPSPLENHPAIVAAEKAAAAESAQPSTTTAE